MMWKLNGFTVLTAQLPQISARIKKKCYDTQTQNIHFTSVISSAPGTHSHHHFARVQSFYARARTTANLVPKRHDSYPEFLECELARNGSRIYWSRHCCLFHYYERKTGLYLHPVKINLFFFGACSNNWDICRKDYASMENRKILKNNTSENRIIIYQINFLLFF